MSSAAKTVLALGVVAAIVWLAASSLGTSTGDNRQKYTFSQVLNQARATRPPFRQVTFHPSKQEIEVQYNDGTKATVAYPVDQSAFEFQQLLERHGVLFDAKRTGSSAWWSILTSLLPFVLLFVFWIFLMTAVQRKKDMSRV